MIARLTRSAWFRALVTVSVLGYLATRIDFGDTVRALLRLSPAAGVALAVLLILDRALMIWRWIILLRATGQRITAKSATWIYLVSSFVGAFLPAGVGGDVARAYTLTQRTADGSAAIASVAADRLLGLASIVLVAVIGAASWRSGSEASVLLMLAGGLCLAACIAFLWADVWARAIMPDALGRRRLGLRLLRYADALSVYRGHRGAMLTVLVVSIGVQLLRIFQAYLLGRGIGIDVPFGYYLVFMPVGLIALLLPISISGFGAPQGIIVWLLQPVGVPAADALALSTLVVLSGIVANLPGAWLYLRERRAH